MIGKWGLGWDERYPHCLSRIGAHLLLIFLLAQGVHVSSNGGSGPSSRPSQVSQRGSSGLDGPVDSTSSSNSNNNNNNNNNNNEACPNGETWCSAFDGTEKLALEAIRSLHRQLDDDNNGNIDLAESDEFLREELKYDKNVENRQRAFHRDDDNQVSVRELWESWVKSEVHNWTIDQTVEWLSLFVGLPQHKEKFLVRSVNGTVLPILAVNHNNFLTTVIGIKDSITKQKIAVKAMDVVLFGPPRDTTNYLKDAILTTLLAVAVIACYLVYNRYQASQDDLSKMSKHMAELSKAEETLLDLQKELEKAKTDQEMKEKEAAVVKRSNIDGNDPDELIKLREENMVLRNELHRAEVELQDKCWVPPPALQHWLQYTYEMELKTYNKKKNGAERQLKQAKDACDKLKKKRSSLMGAFVSTHGRSIDDVDKAILEARTSLTEITIELQERMHRWKQIEILVGCPVMNNPGLPYLENLLKVYGRPQAFMGPGSVISNSQDDMDDDGASSIYCPSAVHKLIGTSTFLMFPGHLNPSQYPPASPARVFNYQQSASDYSSVNNMSSFGAMSSSGSSRPSHSNSENTAREKVPISSGHCSIPPSHSCQNSAEIAVISEDSVSGHTSHTAQMSMSRSKSVTSMLSLRDRGMSRESSSKDSSTGEEEALGEASDGTMAKDRRVTFRGDRRVKVKSFTNGLTEGPLVQDEDMARDKGRRILPKTSSYPTVENTKSKPEEGGESEPQKGVIVEQPKKIMESGQNGDLKVVNNRDGKDVKNGTSEVLRGVKIQSPEKSKIWTTISTLVGHGQFGHRMGENKSKSLFKKNDKSQELNTSVTSNGHIEREKTSRFSFLKSDKSKDKSQELKGIPTSNSFSFPKKPRKMRGFFSSFRRKGEDKLVGVDSTPKPQTISTDKE